MEQRVAEIEGRIASRLKELRTRQELTLDELSRRSGVSRSMISLIERAESSPTASVLDKLSASLGVTLASLFAPQERGDAAPVARRKDQPEWRDPETGYVRRNLSPPGFPSPIELVEVVLPSGTRVAYDSGFREPHVDQQVFVLEGAIEVTRRRDAASPRAPAIASRCGSIGQSPSETGAASPPAISWPLRREGFRR